MVAPDGLLGVVDPLDDEEELELEVSFGFCSCVEPLLEDEEPVFDEPLLLDEDEEVVSGPPEQATSEASERTKPAANRCLKAFMAARHCEGRAKHEPP